MVLSDGEVEWMLSAGELVIDPMPPTGANGRIKGISTDLLLDDTIWIPKDDESNADFTVNLDRVNTQRFIRNNYVERQITEEQGYDLQPGAFFIGRTRERVELSVRLAGRIEGRSRFARLGIGVHVTAPKIDPGFTGRITLEFFNLGKYTCKVVPGMNIATLIVEWLGEPAKWAYGGEFQNQ